MNKYKIGEIINAEVSGIEKYGIFVNIDKLYKGLIHISEITEEFVNNIYDYVKIGEQIKVKIISIDAKKHQMKLSIKDFDYKINKTKKTILKETKNGFLTLATMLDKWIEEKIKEIINEKTKK